jgi:hypothetical protein
MLGWIREPLLRFTLSGRPLAPLSATAGQPWFDQGRINGAYPTTTAGSLSPEIPRVGSFVDADAWVGRIETVWFAPAATIHIGVAGYPNDPGCKLRIEFRAADGTITPVPCSLRDPREQWTVWQVESPAGARAARVVAEDAAPGPGGWLAFSHPFRALPLAVTTAVLHLQVYATLALALTLVFGPGLILHAHLPRLPLAWRAVALLGPGPLLLAFTGGVIWLLSGRLDFVHAGTTGVALLWATLGAFAHRSRFDMALSPALSRTFALTGLLATAVAAKTTSSLGPSGELFRGTISRNFTIGDRIDSRYSYHVVQAAAHHLSPAEPRTEKMFFPWTFFSRGPLAGLTAIPIVGATHSQPPMTPPDQPWSPFDPEGFVAYRLTLVALASTIVPAFFLLLVPLCGERWALLGAGLLALSPFGVHEVMFTWPKWVATSCAVLAFLLAHDRRPFAAGVCLAVGFLFHPLVLLWSPWLGFWTLVRAEGRLAARVRDGASIAGGTALLVLPWMALGAWMPHLPDTPLAGQGGFLRYWMLADWHTATWESWWRTRWLNFANTFVPLHVWLHGPSFAHHKFTSAYEASSALVKFGQVWWVSLPFGLGLGLWAVSLAALLKAVRLWTAATVLFLVLPALFIVAYWGMDPLGLMRECGHPLFVALLALTCLVAAQPGSWLSRLLAHRVTPWLQLPETLLMLWLTTFANRGGWGIAFDHLDGPAVAVNLIALSGAALLLSRARSTLRSTPVQVAATSIPASLAAAR